MVLGRRRCDPAVAVGDDGRRRDDEAVVARRMEVRTDGIAAVLVAGLRG